MKNKPDTIIAHEYYSKKVVKLQKTITSILKKTSEDNVHELRVEIKKLKGVLGLFLKLSTNKNVAKLISELNIIFKPAGELRDLQITINKLDSLNLTKKTTLVFKKYLKSREAKLSKKLRKSIINTKTDEFQKLFHSLRNDFMKTNSTKVIGEMYKFIYNELKTVKYLACAGKNQELLHHARIRVKTILAIMDFMIQNKIGHISNESYLKFKKAGSLVGNWHDQLIIIKIIAEFLKKEADLLGNSIPVFVKAINKIEINMAKKIPTITRELKKLTTQDIFTK